MENAANAIKIAGELLIGLLLISLFVFVFNQMENAETARDNDELLQQTIEFNKKFEAFNKTSMYGTDLISVLALAYATNQTANASTTYKSSSIKYDGYYDPDTDNSINIRFILNTDINAKTTETEYYTDPETNTQIKTSKFVSKYSGEANPKTISTIRIFRAGYKVSEGGYSLKADPTKADEMLIVENIKKIVIDGNKTEKSYETHTGYYSEIKANTTFTIEKIKDTQGFSDLKKAIFECYKVEYSQTGRIKEMYFIEKDTN